MMVWRGPSRARPGAAKAVPGRAMPAAAWSSPVLVVVPVLVGSASLPTPRAHFTGAAGQIGYLVGPEVY